MNKTSIQQTVVLFLFLSVYIYVLDHRCNHFKKIENKNKITAFYAFFDKNMYEEKEVAKNIYKKDVG